jgi:hypothetical protein
MGPDARSGEPSKEYKISSDRCIDAAKQGDIGACRELATLHQ